MPDFTSRVRRIVDRYEFGNVSAFARRIGISQRGAAKIVSGETQNPGQDILESICRKYPVDPAWLLLGEQSETWAASHDRVQREARQLVGLALIDFARLFVAEPDTLAAVTGQLEASPEINEAISRIMAAS